MKYPSETLLLLALVGLRGHTLRFKLWAALAVIRPLGDSELRVGPCPPLFSHLFVASGSPTH